VIGGVGNTVDNAAGTVSAAGNSGLGTTGPVADNAVGTVSAAADNGAGTVFAGVKDILHELHH
jgi:hypothetical protein